MSETPRPFLRIAGLLADAHAAAVHIDCLAEDVADAETLLPTVYAEWLIPMRNPGDRVADLRRELHDARQARHAAAGGRWADFQPARGEALRLAKESACWPDAKEATEQAEALLGQLNYWNRADRGAPDAGAVLDQLDRLARRLRTLDAALSDQAANGSAAATESQKPVPPVSRVEPERPKEPTADYCLIPPNTIRWMGTAEVPPRVYNLFAAVLGLPKHVKSIHFDKFKREMLEDERLEDKTAQNRLYELGAAAEGISFPWGFGTKSMHMTIDRTRPGRPA